jgi:O-antigen/teichoic acid export membrane protein
VVAQPLALFRRHQTFVRDVATLITGKAAAVLVNFLSMPIIARLFEPEHFGVGALFVSLITIAATLATLSWERAVVIAKGDAEARSLCKLATSSLLGSCGLLWLAVLACIALGLQPPFSDKLGPWIWVLPIGLMLLGLSQVADSWLTRTKQYRTIAFADFLSTVITSAARAGSGLLGSSVWGVICGYILGKVAELLLVFSVIRPWKLPKLAREEQPDLRDVGVRNKDFPLYSAPNAFIRIMSQELPTVMLALMFSPAVVGFYAMASKLARLPLNLSLQALQRVFLQRLAEITHAGRPITPVYTRITATLAALAFVPFALLWLVADTLLVIFLGPRWEVAGHYVVILVPWLYALWISNPAGTVMTVLRKQALLLRVQILLAVARLAVFAVAYKVSASPEATLQAFVAVSTLAGFGSVLTTWVIVRRADRQRSAPITEHSLTLL